MQESWTEGECQPYYMDCNHNCTPRPNATHSSSSFMLFSVAIYSYNFHHVDVSINFTHQLYRVALLDINCQFMSKGKDIMAIRFIHGLSSLCKRVTCCYKKLSTKHFCPVLFYACRKSFQFFRINAERTTGLRTPLPIFCLFVWSTSQTMSKRVELSWYIYGKTHALHSPRRS